MSSKVQVGVEKGRPPDFGSLHGGRVVHNIMQDRIESDALPARGRLPKSFSAPSVQRILTGVGAGFSPERIISVAEGSV